jgi:CheY-like chemotaxis protein
MNILYVEDDIDDYSFFVDAIQEINPEVECTNAINGLQALQMLEEGTSLPDVIVLDINMPAMDGKACLKAMKTDPRFKEIPVYIYTTSNNPLDITHCKQLGAADYLSKRNSYLEAKQTLGKIFQSVLR